MMMYEQGLLALQSRNAANGYPPAPPTLATNFMMGSAPFRCMPTHRRLPAHGRPTAPRAHGLAASRGGAANDCDRAPLHGSHAACVLCAACRTLTRISPPSPLTARDTLAQRSPAWRRQ